MAYYTPPIQNLALFDPIVFQSGDEALTYNEASKQFLKYPNAQGTQTLLSTTINGVLTVNNNSSFKRPILMNEVDPNNRTIKSSFYNFYGSTISGLIENGTIYNTNTGQMYFQNSFNGGNMSFFLNDSGGVQSTPLQLLNSGINLNKPTSIAANNNLFMSGTGILSQAIPSGATQQNILKRSNISINSGSASGSGITALELFDEVNGKGCFILPNIGAGALTNTPQNNDCAFISRNSQNSNALCFANWNSNFKNGMRIYTTDINNSGITLQCGQNSSNDWSEFRMDYNRTTNTRNISFNSPINFNPTTPFPISSGRRLLSNLGTLHFLDISGGGFGGRYESDIYTNSVSISGAVVGMYYDCGVPGGYHIFSASDNAGNVSTPIYYGSALTSVANTFIIRNPTIPSNRLDFSADTLGNYLIRARSVIRDISGWFTNININCDSVNPSGVATNNNVLNLNPTYIEVRRPIEFNYLTSPNDTNHLGYQIGPVKMGTSTISSAVTTQNYGSFSINNPGVYNITVLIGLGGNANHTLTACQWSLDGTSATFPSTSTPTKYTPSIVSGVGLGLNTTTTSYLNINCMINATTNNTFYINFLMSYSGGGTTNVFCVYQYTRIG